MNRNEKEVENALRALLPWAQAMRAYVRVNSQAEADLIAVLRRAIVALGEE